MSCKPISAVPFLAAWSYKNLAPTVPSPVLELKNISKLVRFGTGSAPLAHLEWTPQLTPFYKLWLKANSYLAFSRSKAFLLTRAANLS